jgi:hypothetical protein
MFMRKTYLWRKGGSKPLNHPLPITILNFPLPIISIAFGMCLNLKGSIRDTSYMIRRLGNPLILRPQRKQIHVHRKDEGEESEREEVGAAMAAVRLEPSEE